MHLAGGAAIFGLFIVVYFAAVVFSLYTRRGSAINHHPYGQAHGDAAGAAGPSTIEHDRDTASLWTHGTR
jgi:hypothetical protein